MSDYTCSECNEEITTETAVKITHGGFICDKCCEEIRVGNDIY